MFEIIRRTFSYNRLLKRDTFLCFRNVAISFRYAHALSESNKPNVTNTPKPSSNPPPIGFGCVSEGIKPAYLIRNSSLEDESTEEVYNFAYHPISSHPLKLVTTVSPSVLAKARLQFKDLPSYYLSLSKFRLSSLVMFTSIAGYMMGPSPFDVGVFLSASIGTLLLSAGANTVNQIVEVPYDSEMIRTKGRVLVRELLSIPHAVGFALSSAATGLVILTYGANPLSAILGATNLFLYTSVYTPLKRQSIINTWVGSVVGAIPPLMGWAASEGVLDGGGYLLAGILFSWQFVHFNSLSWNLRGDYKRAGYRMMSVSHPDLCVRTCLRYSSSLIVFCTIAPMLGVTSWFFAVDSLPFNLWAVYLAYNFWKNKDSASSRKLFRYSLIHLPILVLLMIISKTRIKSEEFLSSPILMPLS